MHDQNEAQARQAIQDLARLEAIQKRFVEKIAADPPLIHGIGSLTASSQMIECNTLGFAVRAVPRVVRAGSRLSAVEYRFEHEADDQSTPVFTVYLQANGTLTVDPAGATKFDEFNNTYIHKHLVTAIAAALVASTVCSPSSEASQEAHSK